MVSYTLHRSGIRVHPATLLKSALFDHRGRGLHTYLTGSALFFALSISAWAQTSEAPQSGSQADPSAKICDEQKPGDGNELKLGLRRSSSNDLINDNNSSEQETGSQLESNRVTPTVRRSEAAPAEPVCSKTKSGSEADPAPDPILVQQATPKPPAIENTIVSDSNGNWTIYPRDGSLREVMQSIHASTGIPMDLPAEGLDEHVFGNIGPKPPREVLSQLLEGAAVNYVLQTSPQNPEVVTRLFVTSRIQTAGAKQVQSASATIPALQGPQAYGAAGFVDENEAEVPQAVPVTPQPKPTKSVSVPGIPAGFNLQQAAASAHKTPAQLLNEMQLQQIEILDAQTPPPSE
ncbi:MAG: hypothetical protein ABSG96_09865 [Terracidiphilus sp.]